MRSTIITLLFTLSSFTLTAQDANEMVLQNAFRDLQGSSMHEQLPYYTFNKGKMGSLKGSALMDENWQEGLILTLDDELYKAKLQYNAVSDEVYVWTEEEVKVLPSTIVRGVRIEDKVFVPYPIVEGKKEGVNPGFLEVLVEGQAKLFIRHYAVVEPIYEVYPTQGKVPTGDSRIVHKEDYYYAIKDRPAAKLKTNRGSLMDALSLHRKAVARYAKENELGPRNKEDLIALFQVYNEKSELRNKEN